MMKALASSQALARVVLAEILACIRRRSEVRYNLVLPKVKAPSFFLLAEAARCDPHLTRHAFLQKLDRIKAAWLGLKGKGRIGGGRKS